MADPDSAILTAATVTLGSTVAASAMPEKYGGEGKLPSARLLFGTAISFIGLSMLADAQPKIAVPLAAAIAVTASTYYGIPIMEAYFTNNTMKGKDK